ncbi:mRNA-decapping enzyme subunit 2 [Orbilia brochopaga]|uniref:mRNA-decapping enzyme subunit 2 n=1 Tax=Orbilia brochopaga TaxID=3140254 RepID=A0AAV9UZ43_9PEZI
MELPSSYATARFDEVLSDLSVRFIINLPQEELVSRERVCFQIEEAHWYYDDFVREGRPDLPSLNLMTFLGKIFAHNSMLSKWGMHQDAYREFMEYKHRVPVRGGILLNAKMDKVVLVKGWKAGASWAFPRGKINKDEADHICAVREVLEETGFDASELIDPDSFLLDDGEADRHLQLYLIKDVPEDFKFHPLSRKEISEVAWFPIADLQSQYNAFRKKREAAKKDQKGGEQEPERSPETRFRAYKIYNFLPGIVRWTKDQRRVMRQQARKKNHGQVYETEPESSAVETSPPRPPKSYENDPVAMLSGGLITIQKQKPQTPQSVPQPVERPAAQDEASLSLASAKLREMIGIGSTPVAEPSKTQFDKVGAGQSLLAQLQASGSATPTEQPTKTPNPPAGASIPLSLIFGTSSKQLPQKPKPSQQPLEFRPPSNRTSSSSNFNPSVPPNNLSLMQAPVPQGPRNGYKRQGQNAPPTTQQKPQVKILQRGQPLPDSIQKAPKVSSPVATNPPSLPPLAIPQAPPQPQLQQQFQPQPQQQQVQQQLQPQPPQPSQPATAQNEVSSPNARMARRPLLTIDSFIPPNPTQQPTKEHKGNLLDILKGARPPPPAQPAMKLDAGLDRPTVPQPSVLSLGAILAKQGIKIPDQPSQSPTQNVNPNPGMNQKAAAPTSTEPKAPVNGVAQKPANSEHLATLMRSLNNYTPKKITPPATLSSIKTIPPPLPKSVENTKPPQVPAKPAQALASPLNGIVPSPTTSIPTPTTARTPTGTGSINGMGMFDRRATIKPEQANTLLGLVKSPAVDGAAAPAPASLLASTPPTDVVPRNAVPHKETVEKMVAPPMKRTGSLSVEQTQYLMNLLDTVASQHGY